MCYKKKIISIIEFIIHIDINFQLLSQSEYRVQIVLESLESLLLLMKDFLQFGRKQTQ